MVQRSFLRLPDPRDHLLITLFLVAPVYGNHLEPAQARDRGSASGSVQTCTPRRAKWKLAPLTEF